MQKPTRASEDDGELRRDKALKTVSFHDSVSVITAPHCNMELDAHHESQHGFHESQHGFSDSQHDYPESQHDYPESQHDYPESQHGYPESQHGGQNGLGSHSKVLDSEVAQEIRYLDQVLEANGCDGSTDGPTNGTSTPECSEVHIDGSSPSVFVSGMTPPSGEEVRVEGGRQTTFVDTEVNPSNGHSADSSFSSSSSFSSTSSFSSAKKEAPRFELRAFQEERKPSRLFETPTEKEVRVKKVRPSEEMLELERERLELIRGQAVKKNPGIATKWWNPPQERTLEEELDPEQLDSHRKYQQRKQQRSQAPGYAHMASQPPVVTFDLPETTSGEDVVVEQIDFLAARKQFLQSEQAKQGGGTRRDVAPQIYSAKPFSVSTGNRARSPLAEPGDVTTAQMERINYSSEESPPPGKSHMTWAEEGGGDFTCARAVMTILREEDSEGRAQPLGSSYHLEEFDSGLDELSLRSQDTAVLETLSNDLSLDTVSDQDALSLPPTPQPTTPVNGRLEPGPLAPPGYAGPSEAELEYHAGILVQNAIQQALVSQEQDWPPSHSLLSPTHTLPSSMPSPQTQSSPLSSPQTQSSPLPLTSPSPSFPSTSPLPASSTHQPPPDKLSVTLSPNPHQSPTTSPPAQRPSPGPERREGGPRIRVQSSYARALAAAPDPTPAPAPAVAPAPSRPTQPYPAPPSSPPREKQEFSYFSKYSEAAELRSTAATHAPEAETSAGPFRLRSRKQKTLSVIEAEIRAAQEREEELKKQRQTLGVRPAPGHAPGNRQTQRVTISPGDKMKTNSLPARLTLTSRTAPGKIEKIRPAPPVSPSSSEGPPASPLSDQGSDDSGGRPKNFMQTLMEDYETHKVKRRDKQEDNSYARLLLASEVTTEVLEATRVTRRKSNMALKWEAGIYANQDEGEEEEEEEEEEE